VTTHDVLLVFLFLKGALNSLNLYKSTESDVISLVLDEYT